MRSEKGRETAAEEVTGIREGAILLVDKPAGWTSFDVVNKIRHLFGVRRVGHAGTLDPMATGLLIVATGPKTKTLVAYSGLDKEYDVEMALGGRTETYDASSPVVEHRPIDGLAPARVREVIAGFTGLQRQRAPMWSAVKVRGRRLYSYARAGVQVERPLREVMIRSIETVAVQLPSVRFVVRCSKGTYVRTLVDDIGEALGCGAYVTSLRRTLIGDLSIANATTIDDLVRLRQAADVPAA